MASLPARQTASFFAIQPIPSAAPLDGELDALVGTAGFLKGGTTGIKLLFKSSDASDPPLEIDQVGAGPLAEWKQNGVLKVDIANTGVMTFTAIPVGPASNPTTDNQLARKAYVDTRTVSFSIAWVIADPSVATLNSREFGSFIVPAGGTYTFTKGKVMFRTGSHTAGGSLTFKIDQVGVGDRSTLTLDNTNNTIATVYTDNFGDFTATENNIFNALITARSGTITERDVTVVLEGFRTVF